jgi:hypothetical protein
LIVNSGLNQIRDFLNGDSPDPPSHLAVGTGTTAANASDTTLETEVLRKAVEKEEKATAGVIEYSVNIDSTEANGNNLSEIGIFNASSGGVMSIRRTHLAYQKTSSFGVKVVVRHTIEST